MVIALPKYHREASSSRDITQSKKLLGKSEQEVEDCSYLLLKPQATNHTWFRYWFINLQVHSSDWKRRYK